MWTSKQRTHTVCLLSNSFQNHLVFHFLLFIETFYHTLECACRNLLPFRCELCCRSVKFFYTRLNKPFSFSDLALCTGALSRWSKKGPSPNCCHKAGCTQFSRTGMGNLIKAKLHVL